MADSPVIVHLQPEEKEEAVRVLTAAFHNYPAFRFFLQGEGEEDYGRKLRLMVSFFCEARLWMDWPPLVVRLATTPVAAALVNPPVETVFNPNLRQAFNQLKEAVGPTVINNLMAYEKTCERMAPESPHYYLGMIGVLPAHQGQGFARLLLEHVHQASDNNPQASGVCLNTETPKNVPLYRLFGYEVIGEEDVGPLHTWAMFRPSN
jgi:GNAT superfamily N-acetyltransferase